MLWALRPLEKAWKKRGRGRGRYKREAREGFKKKSFRGFPWWLIPVMAASLGRLRHLALDFYTCSASPLRLPASRLCVQSPFSLPLTTGWSSRTSSTSGLVTSFPHSPLNKSWMGQLSSSCTSDGRSHLFHRSPPAPVSVPMEVVSSCL